MARSAQVQVILRGEPGLDPLKLAGKTISGWAPSYRTCREGVPRHPYTTQQERMMNVWLEFCPWVDWFQRADMSSTFSKAYNVAAPLGAPFVIPYELDGHKYNYLPDYVGKLRDGRTFIAEAGILKHKLSPEALAKAKAGRDVAAMLGGYYWIGTEDTLLDVYFWNVASLYSDREPNSSFHEIAPAILPTLRRHDLVTTHELVAHYGPRFSPEHVEAAVRKLVGDAAALGCMVFDLSHADFTGESPFRLLDPDDPDLEPILPAWLPDSLEGLIADDVPDEEDTEQTGPINLTGLPGPAYDAEAIENAKRREDFIDNLAAVTAFISGDEKKGEIAKAHGMTRQNLGYLVRRAQKHGQAACVPYWVYDSDKRGLHAAIKDKIRELWGHPSRPSVMAVTEDDRLEDVVLELKLPEPAYDQVWRYIAKIAHDPDVVRARAGLKHEERPNSSPMSYMLSIKRPGSVVQVDDHEGDINVVTKDGTAVPHKVHALVMFCVATSAILAAVLCLGDPTEEDYMRLVKQAMESKTAITLEAGCSYTWDCSCKPVLILHDRGKIFDSARAKAVLVDRFRIFCDRAPAYTPQVKGHIEALFTWISKKFFHRFAATTKSNPTKRGAKHDPAQEAEKAGITLEVLEHYFIRAIVDGYMRERDRARGGRRYRLWQEAVATYGVPRYLGSKDDLLLMLMKAQNPKNETKCYLVHPSKGVKFLGRFYVAPQVLGPLSGRAVEIRFDRRDISVIYIFYNGAYQGAAPCPELAGRRYSIWEHEADVKMANADKRAANKESLEARRHILRLSKRGKAAHRKEAEKTEKERQFKMQELDIHTQDGFAAKRATPAAQATINLLERDETAGHSPLSTGLVDHSGPEVDADVATLPKIIPMRRASVIRPLPGLKDDHR